MADATLAVTGRHTSISQAQSVIYQCYQCGICSGSCPKAFVKEGFLPRRLVFDAVTGMGAQGADKVLSSYAWDCITCGKCQVNCPHGIDILSLVVELRKKNASAFTFAHGTVLKPMYNLMLKPEAKPNKRKYIASDVRTDKDSKTLFFIGCSISFDIIFKEDVGFNGAELINNSLRLLNKIGIEPAIMEDEKCCGHDFYWRGEKEIFEKFAKENGGKLAKYERIIASCPECARTLASEYKALGYNLNVLHLSQILSENLDKLNEIDDEKNKAPRESIVYHDSCRLGRFMNVYEEPRKVLKSAGYDIEGLPMEKEQALCCGVSAWVNCDDETKRIREMKLRQVKESGSKKLVVPCPKCEIHLKCLQIDKSAGENYKEIEIINLPNLLIEKAR